MGTPDFILLCLWHVKQAWSRSIPKHLLCKDKKERPARKDHILKTLDEIMYCPTEKDFYLKMESLKLYLDENGETEVKSYLETYYENRVELWSGFTRFGIGLNTNNYYESFHS